MYTEIVNDTLILNVFVSISLKFLSLPKANSYTAKYTYAHTHTGMHTGTHLTLC